MTGPRIALLSFGALLAGALGMSGPAPAQCRLCSTPSTQVITSADSDNMRIEIEARLDFDQLVVRDNSPGSVQLRPDGSSTVSGSVGAMSGRAMVGTVMVHGEPGRFVRVDMPTAITLHGIRGGTIRLDSLVTDLQSAPRLDSEGMLQFRFGGALHFESNADGDFRGDIPITVDYL